MKTMHFTLTLAACTCMLASCVNDTPETISFETLQAERHYTCPGDSAVKCFDVSYNLEFPECTDSEVGNAVRTTLVTDLFDKKYADADNAALLGDYIADCEDEYNQNASDYEAFAATNFYIENLEAKPLFQNAGLLTYEATRYIFTGGAHGMSSTVCWVFDLETGNQLTEDDIFVSNVFTDLTDLLRTALHTDLAARNLSPDDFFIDQVQPNGNFAVTGEGIYYQFNPYDIAPYAMGDTRLLLAPAVLKPLLRKGTPVYNLYYAE